MSIINIIPAVQKVIWLIHLDKELGYPYASEIINSDENRCSRTIVQIDRLEDRYHMVRQRQWTVTIYLSSESVIVGWTLILHEENFLANIAVACVQFRRGVTATAAGYRTDETWHSDVKRLSMMHKEDEEFYYIYLALNAGKSITTLTRVHCVCSTMRSNTQKVPTNQSIMGQSWSVCFLRL